MDYTNTRQLISRYVGEKCKRTTASALSAIITTIALVATVTISAARRRRAITHSQVGHSFREKLLGVNSKSTTFAESAWYANSASMIVGAAS
jgi:hypothetical protein